MHAHTHTHSSIIRSILGERSATFEIFFLLSTRTRLIFLRVLTQPLSLGFDEVHNGRRRIRLLQHMQKQARQWMRSTLQQLGAPRTKDFMCEESSSSIVLFSRATCSCRSTSFIEEALLKRFLPHIESSEQCEGLLRTKLFQLIIKYETDPFSPLNWNVGIISWLLERKWHFAWQAFCLLRSKFELHVV